MFHSDGYNPVDGTYGDVAVTTAFADNATDGVYGYMPITLAAGDVLTFNWAFMTEDYWTLDDYAMLLFADGQDVPIEAIKLARIGHDGAVVPEPTTMILLGSGLLGLVALRRKRA